MTRKDNLIDSAIRSGLAVYTYSPGDGITRYRFFKRETVDEKQTYFGPANGIYTALGIKEAEQYLAGYHAHA